MKPASAMVVAKLRGGRLPTALELGAMLNESGCDQAEARDLVARYAAAIGEQTSEERLMSWLRSFSLER